MGNDWIVKKYIDEMDYLGLLASHAPDDEFDCESREISDKINYFSTAQEISWIIAEVFSKNFSSDVQPKIFLDVAEKIYQEIHQ